MANEFLKTELAAMVDEFQVQMQVLADYHRKRSQLTATGTALQRRVTVVLNADGVVIETRFDPDLDLHLSELAAAVTEAAQAAATELASKTAELTAPIQERRDRLPKMSDLLEEVPDLTAHIPEFIPASIAPPNAAERRQHDDSGMVFTDVEELERPAGQIIADDRW
ncbi:YbaB/EbfC family nucleoid-associated protein [Nocardia inohanensis]|uniref:YbaB/EbfC family nucleoid-associated protein n=1 Tax=Nocardia inohanensis TaxID=209246 RepID=UPI0008325F2C|nr:YbaB/EbfC family nucleoid-associated protein [Nocardia inohanensis]